MEPSPVNKKTSSHSNMPSSETDVNIRLIKAWTAINRLVVNMPSSETDVNIHLIKGMDCYQQVGGQMEN